LQEALADTEKTGEGSTWWTMQAPIDSVAPQVDITVLPPHTLDNDQQSGPTNINLIELEIVLENPNLHPEDRQFAKSAKFKNVKKMVPGSVTTAR
jgi:hypothetical protein